MKIIKYIDIIATEYNDEGEPYDVVHCRNIGIPEYIDRNGISSISPYFTKEGKLYKNVSLVVYEGQQMKVVGNYNDIYNRLHNLTNPIEGYYGKTKQREKTIEDRAEVTSKTKRGTEDSSS